MLLHALLASGAQSTEPEGPRVVAIFVLADPGARDALDEEVRLRLRAGLPGWDPGPLAWFSATPPEAPRTQAGRAFLERVGHPAMDLPLARGFGDGTHPTTLACAEGLVARVRPGDRILDLGAGSGILGTLSLALGAREVHAVERDLGACASLEQLATEHRLALTVHHLEVRPGCLGPLAPHGLGPWDGIVANVAAEPLLPLIPALVDALEPGGWLLISGVVAPERARLDAALATAMGVRATRANRSPPDPAATGAPATGAPATDALATDATTPHGFHWRDGAGWWTGIHHPAGWSSF